MNSSRSRWYLVLAGVLLAAACGGDGGGGGGSGPKQGQLTIAYSALNAKVGDTVSLTAHLENVKSPVAWALSGPGALSAEEGDQVSYVAKEAGTAAVTATAAGLTASVSINVCPGPGPETTITINGLVLNRRGYPIVDQAVFVVGSPDVPVYTNGEGAFTIPGVTPPYDLATVDDATSRVFIYRGLTTPTPTVYVFTQADQTTVPLQLANIAGAVRGGGPTSVGTVGRLGFISPEVDPVLNPQVPALVIPGVPLPSGTYALGVPWRSADPTTTGYLVGLQMNVDPGSGAPLQYWYDIRQDVTLLGGQFGLIGPLLDFRPAATANTQGSIVVPAPYVLNSKSMELNLQDGLLFPIFAEGLAGLGQLDFSYVAPSIAEADVQICARAITPLLTAPFGQSTTCRDALDPQSNGTELEILAAPEPYSPANGANDVVDASTFAWTEFTGGVYLVRIVPTSPGLPAYYIFTDGTNTTVPDLPQVGLNFASGNYAWTVTGFAPYDDIDAFAAGIPRAAVGQFTGGQVPPILPPVPNASVGLGRLYTFTHP